MTTSPVSGVVQAGWVLLEVGTRRVFVAVAVLETGLELPAAVTDLEGPLTRLPSPPTAPSSDSQLSSLKKKIPFH